MIEIDVVKNRLKLKFSDIELFNDLRDYFSIENKGASFAKRYNKRAQERKYAITATGTCKVGLYRDILTFLYRKGVIDVSFSDSFLDYINKQFEIDAVDKFDEYILRYYQKDCVKSCLSNGKGICVLGTGAGKTLICASLLESLYKHNKNIKCLYIVPNIGLVSQTFNSFKDYNCSFTSSMWTGSTELNRDVNVIIANEMILVRRYRQNKWIYDVDCVIIDEAHGLGSSNEITKLINKIKTHTKYGFTGTLPADKFEKWSVVGSIGPVIYEKASKELRDESYLSNAIVQRIEIDYISKIARNSENQYYNELDFIYTNEYRNNLLKSVCEKYNKNILILVNHIRHSEQLLKVLQDIDRPVFLIRGEVDVEEREKIIKRMETEDGVICIAISKIFSVGIDIKNLHMLIFASGGKSFIRTVQSIGRGLRKHPSKTMFNIIDICDNLKYGINHSNERKAFYKSERIQYKTIKLEENYGEKERTLCE